MNSASSESAWHLFLREIINLRYQVSVNLFVEVYDMSLCSMFFFFFGFFYMQLGGAWQNEESVTEKSMVLH